METPLVIIHKEHAIKPCGVNGGAETATIQLAHALARLGKKVFLCANIPEDSLLDKELDNLTYLNFGPTYDIPKALEELKTCYNCTRFHLIAVSRALPLLISQRNENIISRILICPEPAAGAFGIEADIACTVADKIICVSTAQKELLVNSRCKEEKLFVVPNGVNTAIFSPGNTTERNWKSLVFAGALVIDKGAHILIQAYCLLKQKIPELTLDIYGSASLWGREEYLDVPELSAFPDLTFHGAVSQEELSQVFQKAGICVLPSVYFDAFNMVCAEAQATGLPVIGAHNSGMRDIVVNNKTGLLLEHMSGEVLAAEIERLLQTPELLASWSNEALNIVRPRFTWEKSAEGLLSLLNN